MKKNPLENTRLSVAELQERAEILYEASRLITAPLNLAPQLDQVFAGLMHRYGLFACAVLLQEARGTLRCDFATGLSQEYVRRWTIAPGEGLAGVAFASGTPRLAEKIDDSTADPLLKDLHVRQRIVSALFVPLIHEGRSIGLAAYLSREANSFAGARIETLTHFTQHLAQAQALRRQVSALEEKNRSLEAESAVTLKELHLVNRQLVRKVRELKTIYDLALATAASSNIEDIAGVIIQGVRDLVEAQTGAFFLLSHEGELDPISPAFERTGAEASQLACRLTQSALLSRAVTEARPQILNFVDASEPLPESWKGVSIRSVLVLPLLRDNHVRGLFCVLNKVNGLFSDDDVRILALLTSRVADVLQRLTLDAQLRQQVHDLSVLQEMSARLPSPPVLSETVSAIARSTRAAIPGIDVCLFFIHHPESETLAAMGGDFDPALSIEIQQLAFGSSEKIPVVEAFREIRPTFYEKGLSSKLWDKDDLVKTSQLNQLGYFPLAVEQGCIGVMALGSRPSLGLTPEGRRLGQLIAGQVGVIVERARLYERLRATNQKLEQINKLKNEFISMVSHELRTPLTTIKGFVSIVLNEETGELNPQQRHFLETSDRAIDRLTLLVSDLLDISRMEAGQIKMQMRAASIRDVIARVAANFAPQLKAQNLSLTLHVPEGLPPIMADADRLIQVFDNLMTNALKYTSEGGVTISASDKGDYVMVSLRDTGKGIPKEEAEKVFEKFYQIKTGGGYPTQGTGLGLAIVRSIIDSHRGKIWLESDAGRGAEFRFILPRARLSETQTS